MDYMDLYAVYVPTPINLKDTLATRPSSNEHLHGRAEVMTTPHKNEECEGYSPSKPEMWTVKRKMKPEVTSNTVGVGAKLTTLAALRVLPLPRRDRSIRSPLHSHNGLSRKRKRGKSRSKSCGVNSSAHSHANTPPSSCEFSHASAILAARQMMKEQGSTNTYSCESATEEYPMNAYEAKFETSEMMAQERLQVSRNSQRWTQAGWKIDEPCIYFASRPDGCFRGDNCRFIHDEAMRQRKNQSPLGNYHHYDNPEQRGHVGFGFRQHGTNRDLRDYQVGSNLFNNEINDGTSKFRGGRFNKRRHENGAAYGGRPVNKNGGDNAGYRSYHGRQQQQRYDHRNSGSHLNENQFNGSICKTTEPSRKRARTFQVE